MNCVLDYIILNSFLTLQPFVQDYALQYISMDRPEFAQVLILSKTVMNNFDLLVNA